MCRRSGPNTIARMTSAATRFAAGRAVLLALGIPLFTISGSAAYFLAVNPWRDDASDGREACVLFGGLPQATLVEEVRDPTTYWPLGILCEHGSTVIAWQSWPATFVSYASWLVVLALVAVTAVALLRWRFASPRIPAIRVAIITELETAARSVPARAGAGVVLTVFAVAGVLALTGR